MICRICGCDFEPSHHSQKICSEECRKQSRRNSKEKYKQSEKGKAATKRWHNSERFKENEKKYRQKPEARRKAVLRTQRYLANNPDAVDKKRERNREYSRTESCKIINRIATKKYRQTEKGKLSSRVSKYNNRANGRIDRNYLSELLCGNTCYYCGQIIDGKKTIDHKIPTSRNGTNDNSNIVLSCAYCNRQKGNKTESEYREWLNDKNNMRVRAH